MIKLFYQLRNYRFLQIFTIYLRYLIGGAFVFPSIVKIAGERFTTLPTDTEVGFFFEAMYQSGGYWQFLGWSQLIAAFLLMTQRFATLGAMLFFGIILNINIITISVNFGSGTPVITSLLLLAATYLLVWDFPKLRLLLYREEDIKVDLSENQFPFMNSNWWAVLGLILFSFTVIFTSVGGRKNIILWFLSCVIIGFVGLIGYLIIERNKKKAILRTN